MRQTLKGTPTTPVLAPTITSALVARSYELYGSLPGIEDAAVKIAAQLLEIAAKEKGEYHIVIALSNDGDYYFGVRAPLFISQLPLCRRLEVPWVEAGSLGSGCPFDRHLAHGLL